MKLNICIRTLILLTLLAATAFGQQPKGELRNGAKIRSSINRLSQNIQIAPAASTPVTGSGNAGSLAKWSGIDGANTYTLGNSSIFEDKFGKVGIGTTTPTSKLTVAGMIETTLGGYKFPDGTVQMTAAGGSIFHDATLAGNGTQGSPLGVAVPLNLTGGNNIATVLSVTSISVAGPAVTFKGGDTTNTQDPGAGLHAQGGHAKSPSDRRAGVGVEGQGGDSMNNFFGGIGVYGIGGQGSFGGGEGVYAKGGYPNGAGVKSFAGGSDSVAIPGGEGVVAIGGPAPLGGKGGTGIFAQAGSVDGVQTGFAGQFYGDVEVHGNFSVVNGGSKNFKIDHPLDPENKYLYHAAIESSEVLNVYSGNVTTDSNGEAVVTLPEWFEAINRDFRYQLTVLGQFAQAIVVNEVRDNRFTVKTSAPGVKVSWQVTGIRSDAAIRKHPFKLEEEKPQFERGSYLAPEAYDQLEERGVNWARNPQLMQQLKQQRSEAEQGKRQKP